MQKKLLSFILAIMLVLSLTVNISFADDSDNIIYQNTFDKSSDGITVASAVSFGLLNGANIGHDDDYVLRAVHIEGESYSSSANAVILTLPSPLSVGGEYNVSVWFYIPSEENEGKGTILGPGLVINDAYDGDLGVTKFPADNDKTTIKLDTWTEVNVTLSGMADEVKTIDLRFFTNDEKTHPELWYIDNIKITQVGEAEAPKVPTWDLTLPALKDIYSDYFYIGNILEPGQINNKETVDMYKHHYNFITMENAMKPVNIAGNGKDRFNLDGVDRLVGWADTNNIKMVGHTLVWHSQSAGWLTIAPGGAPLTRAEAKENLEWYINEIAGRYAGKIYSWDVVNEAFKTSVSTIQTNWRDALRKENADTENKPSWYQAYSNGANLEAGEDGSDYIYDAFVFTRIADPNAILYYNDFNETELGKCTAIAEMVEELNEQWLSDPRNTEPGRLLIEGIGMQAHYWTANLKSYDVERTVKRFAETGAILSVTEIDIPIGSHNNYGEPTEENISHQSMLYWEVFKIFMEYSNYIERVTFWGKADPQSWRARGNPLLFDGNFEAKPSYYYVAGLVHDFGAASEEDTSNEDSNEDEIITDTPIEANTQSDNSLFPWIVLIVVGGGILAIIIINVLVAKKRR